VRSSTTRQSSTASSSSIGGAASSLGRSNPEGSAVPASPVGFDPGGLPAVPCA
jgi:hypothetical protein